MTKAETLAGRIVLGVASVLEVGAYYIPVVDHLLDTIASPAAVVAGTVAAGALLPFGAEMHPAVKWAAALIAGGGAAVREAAEVAPTVEEDDGVD